MKKRLHDKKAEMAILAALIIISLAEIFYRTAFMGEAVLTTANLGEQLAVIVLAVTILILTTKRKDRACYICYGAWIAYFVLDQLFELPGMYNRIFNSVSIERRTVTKVWTPTLSGIALIFGIGNAFDSMVSLVAYWHLLKKQK